MILDGNDLVKVLGPIVRTEMTAAIFEANMALQKKQVRWFPPDADFIGLFKGKELNAQEREFYTEAFQHQAERLAWEEREKASERNYHKLPLDELPTLLKPEEKTEIKNRSLAFAAKAQQGE